MSSVVITSNGLRGVVFVDGIEVSCMAARVEFRGGQLPVVVLELAPTSVRIDAGDAQVTRLEYDQRLRCPHGELAEGSCARCSQQRIIESDLNK